MARPSAPLLFLASVVLLWSGARGTALWMAAHAPPPERLQVRQPEQNMVPPRPLDRAEWLPRPPGGARDVRWTRPYMRRSAARITAGRWAITGPMLRVIPVVQANDPVPPSNALPLLLLPSPQPAGAEPGEPQPATDRPMRAARPVQAPPAPHWSLTAWLLLRPDALGVAPSSTLAPGQAQLGGTQAGARVGLRLDRQGRWEAHARLVTSGSGPDGIEAAAGINWQPVQALPLRLALERRQQVAGDGGRSAFAAFASGGVSDVALPGRFRLNGYGAAGVVGARRRDLFAEGSATAHRRIAEAGPVSVEAGGGIWAAAQPGATRVDAGPSLRLRLATGTVQPVLSIDWRQRLAGDATPASGVAITLASDF